MRRRRCALTCASGDIITRAMNLNFAPPVCVLLAAALLCVRLAAAETFRVATYNVENYLDQPTESRPHLKSAEARAKIRESICALNPDVIALQEMGGVSALQELPASLKADGLDYPHWEHVSGFDTNIHVAVLSKFPIIARRPCTRTTISC